MSYSASVITEAARQIGIATDPDTVDGRLVERTILRGYATLVDELRQTITDIPKVAPAEAKPASPASFIFTAFWESFEQHKLDNREWKADTASNAEGTRNVFDKLFPAVTVAQLVATPVARDFKSKLLLLPRHYARGERKKMSAEKLIALGRTLPTRDQMQDATANKHFGNFSEYWLYLVGQKKIPADIPNPFDGLHITLKRGRNARKERNNWTPTRRRRFLSLRFIRAAPQFIGARPWATKYTATHSSGCPCSRARWEPAKTRFVMRWSALSNWKKRTRDRFGIWKLLMERTSGSERNVPFAELVLGMGFLEQRVIGRDPAEPLFPELIPQGPGKRRSAAFTDRFAYYRRSTKIYQPRVDFHSFRGNVETDLKNLPGINQAWIDELIGHKSTIRRSEGERYTKQINLPILQRLVNSIRINADLSRLRYVGSAGVAAPSRDRELARFVALAEREMKKKARSDDK